MRVGWCGGGQPMGETGKRPFQLSFNSSLRVEFQGARVTSDGGLILVRELDERLGLSALMERHLADSRQGRNVPLPLPDLLRQSTYSRLAGYEDVNDAERLSQDPTFRSTVAGGGKERCRKSRPQLGQFRRCWFGISYRWGR